MANTNAPFGFRPNNHTSGGIPARTNAYVIADQYNTDIFFGDLVRSDTTTGGLTIERAAADATDTILGVFQGCQYVAANGDVVWTNRWTANTDATGTITAFVMDDPNVELVAQITTVAATDVYAGFDFNVGTGNASTGVSGAYIDEADTINPKLRVEGLSEKIDGLTASEYGAFAKVRCRILNHEKAPGIMTAL